MNFIYSFINKPKHIFLVHGEMEAQNTLEEKIKQDAGISVTIPEFGETYELNAISEDVTSRSNEETKEKEEAKVVSVKMTNKIERRITKAIRREVITRLEKLKEELKDMETYVRQDIEDNTLRDEDIYRINEKIKDLEKQIINVIEG